MPNLQKNPSSRSPKQSKKDRKDDLEDDWVDAEDYHYEDTYSADYNPVDDLDFEDWDDDPDWDDEELPRGRKKGKSRRGRRRSKPAFYD